MRAVGVTLSFLTLSCLLWGCSGSSTIDDGVGASTGSGGTGDGGAAATGGGGVGGNMGSGGAGGQPDCPDLTCSKTCPAGTWLALDGCPSCACASELEMEIRGVARPAELVSMDIAVTEFIGGIDRWIFDFVWHYDDPNVSDDAEDVALSIALMRIDPAYEPNAMNVSWCQPEDAGMPLEARGSTFTLYGFGVITSELSVDDGFLSIRQNGDLFEGHAYFDLSIVGGGASDTVHVAAPFSVAVP